MIVICMMLSCLCKPCRVMVSLCDCVWGMVSIDWIDVIEIMTDSFG